jgi:hypothetical protein
MEISMKKIMFFIFLFVCLLLAACSGTPTEEGAVFIDGDTNQVGEEVEPKIRLNTDYEDALPVDTQLTIGTLMLEDSEDNVSAEQAVELLPMWKLAESLYNSDTAADVEKEAVISQIQDAMNPEQIAAIADLQLSSENSGEMMQELQDLMPRGEGQRDGTGERPAGGRPGGDMPEGLRPQGQGMGEGSQVSPEQMETMQAMRDSGELSGGGFMTNPTFMFRAVINLLESKVGE